MLNNYTTLLPLSFINKILGFVNGRRLRNIYILVANLCDTRESY